MTIQQAEAYLRDYQALLEESETRGARRNPSLLPTTKQNLMRAIKLLIAQLYYIGSDSKDFREPLIKAAMAIDSFSDMPMNATGFISAMQSRRDEIEAFRHELLTISRGDPFFWQRVFSLAGIDYETRRHTFFDKIKDRLRLTSREESNATAFRTNRWKPVGRISID